MRKNQKYSIHKRFFKVLIFLTTILGIVSIPLFFILSIELLVYYNIPNSLPDFEDIIDTVLILYKWVCGLLVLFLVLNFLEKLSKKFLNKYYVFEIESNINYDLMTSFMEKQPELKETIHYNNCNKYVLENKAKFIYTNIHYYIAKQETFDNVKFKENMLEIKKSINDNYRLNISNNNGICLSLIFIFIDTWTNELEKHLHKYMSEYIEKGVNIYIIYNNKLYVSPMYIDNKMLTYYNLNDRAKKLLDLFKRSSSEGFKQNN